MAGSLNYGFNPNQSFDTSSLMGPAALDQSILSYLRQLYGRPTDFSGPNGMFGALMSPALRLGPNGVMLDPKQNQAAASSAWLENRASAASQNQQNNQAYQGIFGDILNKYSGTLNNIQSLTNAANRPVGGLGSIFSSFGF